MVVSHVFFLHILPFVDKYGGKSQRDLRTISRPTFETESSKIRSVNGKAVRWVANSTANGGEQDNRTLCAQ
jgi:hypothetical protein